MANPEDQKEEALWHWAEGTKYALETGKSLLLVNGAAAAGILTFVGNHPAKSYGIFKAINMFSVGALTAVIFLACAYVTQLNYGNRAFSGKTHFWAWIWHWAAYLSVLSSILLFVWGMRTATKSLALG